MKQRSVILADVYHPMLEATRGLLDSRFDTVVLVASCESLLGAAKKIRPEIIVTDLSLPASDGQKLLLHLDAQLREFRVIVLGNYSEKNIVESILKTGIKGYVIKQSIDTDLLIAVDKVIGGEIFVSPLVS